eukprot:5058926-Karenia_brevis.AAC.1
MGIPDFRRVRVFAPQTVEDGRIKDTSEIKNNISLAKQIRRVQTYINLLRQDLHRALPNHQQALNRNWTCIQQFASHSLQDMLDNLRALVVTEPNVSISHLVA